VAISSPWLLGDWLCLCPESRWHRVPACGDWLCHCPESQSPKLRRADAKHESQAVCNWVQYILVI